MRVRWLLPCLMCGCVATVDSRPPPHDPAPDPIEPGRFGIVVEPRLGRVFANETSTTALVIAGLHERAEYSVHVQVLDRPDDLTSWVTLATAVTDREPSSTDPAMYE